MFNEMLAKVIKAHIKHDMESSPETYGDWNRFLKSFKVIDWTAEVKECTIRRKIGQLVRYRVRCSFKAPKYENNISKWEVVVYQDGSESVYFDGTTYAE